MKTPTTIIVDPRLVSALWPKHASPYDPSWIETRLATMAERAASGEDPNELRNALLTEIWPWALALADREAARRRSHLDPDEVRSQLLYAAYQATTKVDWARWRTWPRLLQQRVEGARVEAWRAADVLSRRHRLAKQRFQEAVDDETQRQCRLLPAGERERLAADILGEGRRRGGWLGSIVSDRPLTEALGLDHNDAQSAPVTTEEIVLTNETVRAVRDWLARDVPDEVATQARAWLEQTTTTLPRQLRAGLDPHRDSLRARVKTLAG